MAEDYGADHKHNGADQNDDGRFLLGNKLFRSHHEITAMRPSGSRRAMMIQSGKHSAGRAAAGHRSAMCLFVSTSAISRALSSGNFTTGCLKYLAGPLVCRSQTIQPRLAPCLTRKRGRYGSSVISSCALEPSGDWLWRRRFASAFGRSKAFPFRFQQRQKLRILLGRPWAVNGSRTSLHSVFSAPSCNGERPPALVSGSF
jgi:hypothetical protein